MTASGPRTPLAPERFGSLPAVAGASAGPSALPEETSIPSSSPEASGNETPVFSVGEDIPLLDENGATDGTVTIVQVDPQAPTSGGGIVLQVQFTYHARWAITVDSTTWIARSATGSEAPADTWPGTAGRPVLADGPLAAGKSRTGWRQFTMTDVPDSVSIDYRLFGATVFTVLVY
jgi:hypothetical protein